MILFFDTETTGKADFRAPPDAEHQPRLVQLGAVLTDDSGKEMAALNVIVAPRGFTIPEAATSVHGITTATAAACGVELEAALPVFAQLCEKSLIVVGHNVEFDLLILRGECLRAGFDEDPFCGAKTFCTMRAFTPICKLPNQYGYSDFKWPKLQEAHVHAFGAEFDGTHDAMADVRACARLFFWLQNQPKP